MRRLAVSLVVVSPVLLAPGAAQAKGGAFFQPGLSTLSPGQATEVRLFVGPGHRPSGGSVPAPPPGVVPVLVLRASASSRSVRFDGRPLGQRRGSRMVVTLPRTASEEVWKASVRAGGRTYPTVGDGPVVTPADPTAPADGAGGRDDAAVVGGASDPADGGAGPPAWPFVVGGLALAAGAAGRGVARRRRPRRMQHGT